MCVEGGGGCKCNSFTCRLRPHFDANAVQCLDSLGYECFVLFLGDFFSVERRGVCVGGGRGSMAVINEEVF